MKKLYLVTALISGFISISQATESLKMDEVVVTATRIEQSLKKTLSSTSVITREDIKVSQAVDVPSLIKNLPGIEYSQTGGVGKQGSIFMRGTNSNQVLVLLDGVRIGSATTGATALDQIMLDQVDRIEVVRGNVSSLYGSEAIGGVIQIFTKSGDKVPTYNASAGAGTHNTQRMSAGYANKVEDTSYNIQVSTFRTDGISAINTALVPTANPDNDGYENISASGNLNHALNNEHGLVFSFFNSDASVQYDKTSAVNAAHTSRSLLQKLALGSDNKINDEWQSSIKLSQGSDELRNYTGGSTSGNIKTVSTQLAWQNTLIPAEGKSILLGAENLDQRVSSNTLYTKTDRQVSSLYGGYTAIYGTHQLQLNLRGDQYSDFGTANTGLLGYGYDFSDAWRMTASSSTAYRAPTFNDMYAPVAWGPNPNLSPERSKNLEFGLHHASATDQLNLVYFDNRINDLIQYQFPMSQNLAEARIEGIELNYRTNIDNAGIRIAVTAQNPRDARSGQALLRRAKLFSSAAVTRTIGAWRISGEWQYSGEREDYDINTFNRITLESYNLVNLVTSYQLNKQLEMSLRADNLFNQEYMLVHGYNTLGRTLFVGLSYR